VAGILEKRLQPRERGGKLTCRRKTMAAWGKLSESRPRESGVSARGLSETELVAGVGPSDGMLARPANCGRQDGHEKGALREATGGGGRGGVSRANCLWGITRLVCRMQDEPRFDNQVLADMLGGSCTGCGAGGAHPPSLAGSPRRGQSLLSSRLQCRGIGNAQP
jgi:hypothetical protein